MAKGTTEEKVLKKNKILELIIKNSGEYGKEEIAKLLEITPRRVEQYVKELRLLGKIIKSKSKKYYYIDSEKKEFFIFNEIGSKDIREYSILYLINTLSMSKINKKIFVNSIINNYQNFSESEGYINKLLFALQDKGYIEVQNEFIYKIKNPFIEMSKEQLFKCLIYLNIIKNLYPEPVKLHDIYHKVKLILYVKDTNKYYGKDYEKYFQFKDNNSFVVYEEYIKDILTKAIKNNKKVTMIYKGQKILQKRIIEPNSIKYNNKKNKFYLIENKTNEIFKIDRILNIKIEKENFIYKKNSDNLVNSFGISNEPSIDICVEFEQEDFILKKLQRQNQIKETTKIIQQEDKIILFDKVNGINEVLSFIKAFGDSVKRVYPEKLRIQLLEDIELLKARYGDNDVELK